MIEPIHEKLTKKNIKYLILLFVRDKYSETIFHHKINFSQRFFLHFKHYLDSVTYFYCKRLKIENKLNENDHTIFFSRPSSTYIKSLPR